MSEPFIYKCSVEGLTSPEREAQLKSILQSFAGAERIDTNLDKRLLRIISARPFTRQELNNIIEPHGFTTSDIAPPSHLAEPMTITVGIDGMTCRSCEITIERKWKKIPSVQKVKVDAATGKAEITASSSIKPTLDELQQALGNHQYVVHDPGKKSKSGVALPTKRPTFMQLVGLFALVFLIGKILSTLGLFKGGFAVTEGMGFGAIFLVGLIAASSSCIAVVGGLLLSSAAKFNERYVGATSMARMRPVMLFIFGRIVSYTILGGLLGVIGGILTPSPLVTALIMIVAAFYMFVMGLDMLHIAPVWLKRLTPRMPKNLSHRIMDAEGKEHPIMPFALGAATFFLPCGFTQALQLYALTTGRFGTSAMMLLAFALGTAPALLALGYASSSLKGKAGQFFFRFSGALVVVLGLWNIQNGLTIAGYPLNLPSFDVAPAIQAAGNNDQGSAVTIEGNTQVVKMTLGYGGYEPNHFTIKAGMPVRWEVDGTNAAGCTSVLMSRQLGIQKLLERGTNIIEFTPKESGEIAFNCSMGMVRGSFTVLPQT